MREIDVVCGSSMLRVVVGDASHADDHIIRELITRDAYRLRLMAQPDPPWILDIGAHVGSFAIMVKQLWPDVGVVSIEPNPSTFRNLETNTAKLKDVVRIHAAIGVPGKCSVHTPTDKDGLKVYGASTARSGAVQGIDMIDLAGIMEISGVRQFGLVKLDCEGGEYHFFQRERPELIQSFNHLIGEWHGRTAAEFKEIVQAVMPDHRLIIQSPDGARQGSFWLDRQTA